MSYIWYITICNCIIPIERTTGITRAIILNLLGESEKNARGLRNVRSAFRASVPAVYAFSFLYRVGLWFLTPLVLQRDRRIVAASRKRDFRFCEERAFAEQSSVISHSYHDPVRNNEVRTSSVVSVIAGSECYGIRMGFIKHAIFRYFQWTVSSLREKVVV